MDPKKTVKVRPVISRLIREVFAAYPRQLPRTIVYTIAASIFPFFAVFLPKIAIGILEKGGTNVAHDLIKAMLIYFVTSFLVGLIMQKLDKKIQMDNMRHRVIYMCGIGNKTMTMDYNFVEDARFWEENDGAIHRATNTNASGMEGMLNKLYVFPSDTIVLLAMIVLTAMLSPLVLLALVLHVAVTIWVSRSDHNYRYARKDQEAKASRKISYYEKTSTDFTCGKDIRIYNLRDRILNNFDTEVKAYIKLLKKFEAHKYFVSLLGILTLLLSTGLMYGILIYKTYNGMSISSFTMYVSLILSLTSKFTSFGENIAFLKNEGEYVSDAFELIDEGLATNTREKITIPKGETLEIVFDHVDFKYPGTEKYIYRDLNFTIHKGESLAIVGVNGAGKSTLVKLMTGLFLPTAGHIYINGHDTRDFNKQDLYDLYSAVFQDVNVLAFPIRENVTGASENCDDERVKQALTDVGLWDKVMGFEHGLDQMMLKVIDENGTDFSGGERQKLSIARGLYKDAPMVIMDEPTAALDALAEQAIYESFADMIQGKTAVYISHRLASTKFCDKIALFDNTGLLEYGTHDQLMDKKGTYYDMFVIQGKYYQENPEVIA